VKYVIIWTAAVMLANSSVGQEMNFVKLHVDSFTVAGLSVRTNNSKEATPEGEIGKLWRKVSTENFLARIPNRVDDHVIAFYTDYENGKDGMYTYVLGAKVSSKKHLPAEFVARELVSGQYAMFTGKGGPATVDVWKQIWSLEDSGGLERAYKTDYEDHYGSADDISKSHVDIYIGLPVNK